MRKPLTLEDHQASRWIAEPLHLFDCCLVSNGAVALVVTSAERARACASRRSTCSASGQAAPGDSQRRDRDPVIYTGATTSGEQALRHRRRPLADIDVSSCTTATRTPSW